MHRELSNAVVAIPRGGIASRRVTAAQRLFTIVDRGAGTVNNKRTAQGGV